MSEPTFRDLGGLDEAVETLKREAIPPLLRKQGTPMIMMLFQGPPGSGKSTLARAVANEAGVPFHTTTAYELRLRGPNLISEIINSDKPCVVFISHITSTKIEAQIVNILTTSNIPDVFFIGASVAAVDPSPRGPELFPRIITFPLPDLDARLQILLALTRNLTLSADVNLSFISTSTQGFVGADLAALVYLARHLATPSANMDLLSITLSHSELNGALLAIQRYYGARGSSGIPNVKWEDVVCLPSLKETLETDILTRYRSPALAKRLGLGSNSSGHLLFGPPGCGKALIANAVASDAGFPFIHISCPQLLSGSLSAMRSVFTLARAYSPCILFLDEVDVLTKSPTREGVCDDATRLYYQIRKELDDANAHRGIHIIAATSRPDVIDHGVLRSGRLGEVLYVPLPNQDECELILKILTKEMQLDADVDLAKIAQSGAHSGFSGGDLSVLSKEAAKMACAGKLGAVHFGEAARKISLKKDQSVDYVKVCKRFAEQQC